MPVVEMDTKVYIKESLLGKESSLNFLDFNLQHVDIFPSLQFSNYVDIIEEPNETEQVIPKEWENKLFKVGIMSQL